MAEAKVEVKKEEEKKEEPKKQDVVENLPKFRRPELRFDEFIPLDIQMQGEQATVLEGIVRKAFKFFTVEREIASFIKEEYDTRWGKNWHCIVGILSARIRRQIVRIANHF